MTSLPHPSVGPGPAGDAAAWAGPAPCRGADASAWAARAPDVPADWFRHESRLHGVRHTQRVHVHAQRLTADLCWDESEATLVLRAALVHDIGRLHDGWDPWHGKASAKRAQTLRLLEDLPTADELVVLFAVRFHSRSDRAAREWVEGRPWPDGERALRVLWLLKDADALDRVRLPFEESADPRYLRHEATKELLPFAGHLYRVLGP